MNHLDPLACYRAVQARDRRHDGRFFTCVTSTGIYCRPVCPARTPLFRHCRFMPSAAAAQAAGFRPCLRCRPESAPGMGAWCGTSSVVRRALSLIEAGALDEGGVEALCARLGLGSRHLRRLFQEHVGATPLAVAQTRRLLLAQQLIHGTALPMAEVALASGYGSVRRFNEAFQRQRGVPPASLRRRHGASAGVAAGLDLLLPYRPPCDWAALLGFLRGRAIPGVEQVDDDAYSRVITRGPLVGWLRVSHEPDKAALKVHLRFPDVAALPAFIVQVRRLFDLHADPEAIAEVLGRDPALAPLVATRPGLRVPGGWDGFELAVRAILGQQVTVQAATRLAGQLVQAAGKPVVLADAPSALTHAFPSPVDVDEAAVATLGMPGARRQTLLALARTVSTQPGLFDPYASLEEAVAALRAIPGIGEWTAQYIAMRALCESDAFLAGDVGLQRALVGEGGERPSAKALLARAEAWRPWRAYAVLHLWMADAAQEAAAKKATNKTADKTAKKRSKKADGKLDAPAHAEVDAAIQTEASSSPARTRNRHAPPAV